MRNITSVLLKRTNVISSSSASQKKFSKNKILRNLKEDGGPFTRTEEIELYVMNDQAIEEKNKQKRLKLRLQYAKATSVILSKTDLIFRIMNVKNGKRTTKSAQEFADNLKILFGKTQDQDPDEVDTMELFRRAIS